MSHLRLMFLGSPIVEHGGSITTFRTRKALALLVYLAVEGGIHSREELVALLWPESGQSQGRATLRSTLAYLRKALRDSAKSSSGRERGDEAGSHLLITRDTLGFNLEVNFEADWLTLQAAWTAARRPAQLLNSVEAHETDARPARVALRTQLQTAFNLYRDDFLTGFSLEDAPEFDDWSSVQRETCHRQLSLVSDRLSQLQAEGGELIGAIETTSHWVALDPLNELAHRRLMQLHLAAEDRSAALRAYEACRTILTQELNAEPSPETQVLADRIRNFGIAISDLGFEPARPGSEIQRVKSLELPLVGRTQEHLALVAAYRTVRRGQPQVVTLEGEPGIGKSRLAKEFLGWAMAQGADVLQGRAFEAGGRLPYQPVIEALRERVERENAPDDLLSDVWLSELGRLLPELHERYPDLPSPTADDTTAQTQLYEAVSRLGQALAGRAPLILFLDDLQWADAASLDLLQYTNRRWAAAHNPVLMLLALRPEELAVPVDRQSGLRLSDWLLTLQREVSLTRLTLKPLTCEDILQLTQRLVDPDERRATKDEPSSSTDLTLLGAGRPSLERFSQRLFAETQGQPFFLIETLKMLFEPHNLPADEMGKDGALLVTDAADLDAVVNGYLQGDDGQKIPRSVQEMISARLARLGPAGQTTCLAAAVLGEGFSFEHLCRVAGLEESEGLEALEELLERGLLRERRQARARPYLLAHDRFREVIYGQAGQARRRVFHRRAFETLEAAGAAPAELARHALAGGMLERAFDLNVSAGDEAMRLYAPHAAIEHFTRALGAAEQLAFAPSPQLYRARGRAYETVGAFDRAQSDYGLALERARTHGDRQDEWQTLLDLGFLWASRDYDRAGGYFQEALTLARASDDPPALAHSLNRLGNWHVNIEQPFKALQYHREALSIFDGLATWHGRAETLDLLGMASFMCGDLLESLAYYERAVDLFRELNDRRGLVSSLPMMSLVMRGIFTLEVLPDVDVTTSAPLAEEGVQIAREIGWRAGESNALLCLGLTLGFEGQYAPALNFVQNGLAVAEEIEHPLWMTFAHWGLGVLTLDLLALETAEQHLKRGLALAGETGSMLWTRATTALLTLVYVTQGEHSRAESLLEAALGAWDDRLDAVEWSSQTAMKRLLWYARAELALAGQDPLLALQIVDRLIGSSANMTGERSILRLSKLRGEALAALDRVDEAKAALFEAQAAAERQGELPMLWRAHVALGGLYRTHGDQTAAQREFAAAQAIVEKLCTDISDEVLRDNLRRSAALPH